MNKILAAAISDHPGLTITGKSHAECIRKLSREVVQGFIDADNKWVSREEALEIALSANQIKPEFVEEATNRGYLVSEDIGVENLGGDI